MALAPNPPPISMGTTFTWDSGTPMIAAVWDRMLNNPWVLVQTVTRPSADHMAVETWGSM